LKEGDLRKAVKTLFIHIDDDDYDGDDDESGAHLYVISR